MLLLQNNPSIHTLQLRPFDNSPFVIDHLVLECGILSRLPALSTLLLPNGFYAKMETFLKVMTTGPRLSRLVFWISLDPAVRAYEWVGNFSLESAAGEDKVFIPFFGSMSTLSVANTEGLNAIEFIRRCPNLCQLVMRLWRERDTEEALALMTQHYRAGYPSRLRHLLLGAVQGVDASLALIQLLQASGQASAPTSSCSSRLETFHLSHSSGLSKQLMAALLDYHSETLSDVRIYYPITKIESPFIQLFLKSCPSLRYLEMRGFQVALHMEDIVGSSWICRGLEVLRVQIVADAVVETSCTGSSPMAVAYVDEDAEDHLQQQVWCQIGRMSNLRELSLHTYDCEPETGLLSVARGNGLEQLLRLTHLKELEVSKNRDMFSDQDR